MDKELGWGWNRRRKLLGVFFREDRNQNGDKDMNKMTYYSFNLISDGTQVR